MADEFSRSGDTRPATIDDLYAAMVEANDIAGEQRRRIAELEADNLRLAKIMYDTAHVAATLGTAHEGWLRGRFMSISNALNAGIGRPQSSHGMQFDRNGNEIKTA